MSAVFGPSGAEKYFAIEVNDSKNLSHLSGISALVYQQST